MWQAVRFGISFVACLVFAPTIAGAEPTTEDIILRKAIEAYQVLPYSPAQRRFGPKEALGQALFFDPFLSGPKRIACSTCHVRSKGTGDGLRLAIGLGGQGAGVERLASKNAFVVPRNAMPLFNRGSSDFVALFWDGRVQRGQADKVETPLGNRLPPGFDGPLAAAAVFPLAEPDEMLGHSSARSSREKYHGELVNRDSDADNLQDRTLSVFENLPARLLGTRESRPSPIQLSYRELFARAYPAVSFQEVRITHIGNALAAYISAAFELKRAPWDKYVEGDAAALTPSQKKGAVVFFGKGRCAVCHSGTQFSDFRFHGLAVPQLGVGKHTRHIDYGRAVATSRGEDRFAFRTPPLRNVAGTGPWGHSGVFSTLKAVIEHHFNPVPVLYEVQKRDPGEAAHTGRLLAFRSSILGEVAPLSDEDVKVLVEFLGALSSDTVMPDTLAIPKSVPSGIKDFLL